MMGGKDVGMSVVRKSMLLAACICIGCVGHMAYAQQSTAAGAKTNPLGTRSIGEAVVTTQRLEEKLQQVPISVTAISGDELDLIGARGFEDLTTRVPGLMLNGFSDSLAFTIRGITTQRSTAL